MTLLSLLFHAVDPLAQPVTPPSDAVQVAQITATSSFVLGILTLVGVIVGPLVAKRRSKGDVQIADRADARSDKELDLDGFKADAESARAGQVAALELVRETREHYLGLLGEYDKQRAGHVAQIDSLTAVNGQLTEALKVALTGPSQALVETLQKSLADTEDRLRHESEQLAEANRTIKTYEAQVSTLTAKLEQLQRQAEQRPNAPARSAG